MPAADKTKRKRKAYYKRCAAGETQAKKRQVLLQSSSEKASSQPPPFFSKVLARTDLRAGMTGLLVTHALNQERRTTMEVYRLLAEAKKRLESSTTDHHRAENNLPTPQQPEDEDILKCLREEMGAQEKQVFEFNRLKTVVNNCLFILNRCEYASSGALAEQVFRMAQEKGGHLSRNILRLLPVMGTCRADLEEVTKLTAAVWREFIQEKCAVPSERAWSGMCPAYRQVRKTGADRFVVMFKSRQSKAIDRLDGINSVVNGVLSVSPQWTVSTNPPSVVLALNVIRNVACLSILEWNVEFSKYNLAEFCDTLQGDNANNDDDGKED